MSHSKSLNLRINHGGQHPESRRKHVDLIEIDLVVLAPGWPASHKRAQRAKRNEQLGRECIGAILDLRNASRAEPNTGLLKG